MQRSCAAFVVVSETYPELPGRPEKFCLECSADLATVIQLSTEIGAARRAGRSIDALESELSEISRRMLERSQSAGLSDV